LKVFLKEKDSIFSSTVINFTFINKYADIKNQLWSMNHWSLYKKEKVLNIIFPDAGVKRLLNVDKHLIILGHKPINFLISSGDILHSFAIPSFGIKVDAVPGRINTFYLEGSKLGMYYGQCSELCGFGHGFMPIVVEVVNNKKL